MQPSPSNTRSITPPPARTKRPSSKLYATSATSYGRSLMPFTSPTSSPDGRRRELFASTLRGQALNEHSIVGWHCILWHRHDRLFSWEYVPTHDDWRGESEKA